ncbi:MAG TPA: Spy/CpxP family protein refolding chaperone [Syntrophorhabdaceae bacterium]|nr:Spy/CpxP family protein refolding chaperone [Syntrophorhabdaceae bacterium]
MKKITGKWDGPVTRAIIAMLLAFVLLALPGPLCAASSSSTSMGPAGGSKTDRVEARITELHAKLKITDAQEPLWRNVAETMRDNERTMEDLIRARSEKVAMTAVDDLKSYSAIAEAHADGIRKFIPVFEALYNSMSDDQKKIADMLFRHHHSRMKAKAKTK